MVQKLSKDVYYEINQIDHQLQRLLKRNTAGLGYSANENANNLNVNASGVLLGSAIDPTIRNDLNDIKQSHEQLYQLLQ